jgi:hypothetical protein
MRAQLPIRCAEKTAPGKSKSDDFGASAAPVLELPPDPLEMGAT